MKRQIIGAITLTLSMTLMGVNAYANGNVNPLEYEACSNTPEKRAKYLRSRVKVTIKHVNN